MTKKGATLESLSNKVYEKHIFYVFILIIVVLSFFLFNDYFKKDYMPPVSNDFNDYHQGGYIVLKESIQKYDAFFPFWNKYILGGTNYLAKLTQPDFLFPLNLLILLISPLEVATKLIIIVCFLGSAFGMYCLSYYLTKDKRAALISALFYVFNGFAITLLIKGWSEYVRSFCFIPWIFLFIFFSLKSEKWFIYSLVVSILLALQIFAGGSIIFLWTLILIGLFFIFKLLEFLILGKKNIKFFFVFFVILIFASGLTAIRTIPGKEYLKYSDRAVGIPYEQSLWQKITFDCKEDPNYCFWGLIEPASFPEPPLNGFGYKIGFLGLTLFLIGFFSRFKNKYVILFGLISVLSILISLGTPLYYLIYKYAPGFSTHRYPHRALIMFAFSASLVIGYGSMYLLEKLKQKFNLVGIKNVFIFLILIFIVLLDLIFLGYPLPNQVNIKQEIENNEIYNYISEQNGTFRTHVQDIYSNNRGLTHLFIPLGIQFTYGYEQTFNTEYLPVFLSVANSDPAKLFGILNVKYVTSSKEINITGYKFIKRFNYSKYTQSEELNQTYLYENDLFLPRYFIIKNAILVVGDDDSAKQTMYWLMVNDNFDPKKSIIIKGKNKISDYSQEDLMKFKAIVLTKGSVDENSVQNLKKYVEKGNILLPDITRNKQSVEDSEIASMFKDLSNIQYEEIKPSYYSPDKVVFYLKDKSGFVFASEQYSIYPGWEAFVDEKETDLLRANGVFSAIYVDGNKNLAEFEYKSQTFFYGAVISSISLIVIICYMIYLLIKLSNNKKNENQS